MGDLLQPWHLIVLAVVAFLLFGAKRLPELGKGLGEGLKGFKEASAVSPIPRLRCRAFSRARHRRLLPRPSLSRAKCRYRGAVDRPGLRPIGCIRRSPSIAESKRIS